MYWKTDGAYISPNNVNLLRKGGLLETLLDCPHLLAMQQKDPVSTLLISTLAYEDEGKF